jgi:hypothetical protein
LGEGAPVFEHVTILLSFVCFFFVYGGLPAGG